MANSRNLRRRRRIVCSHKKNRSESEYLGENFKDKSHGNIRELLHNLGSDAVAIQAVFQMHSNGLHIWEGMKGSGKSKASHISDMIAYDVKMRTNAKMW